MHEHTILNADHHPPIKTENFPSLASYALYLKHLKAYDVVASEARDRVVLDVGCNVGYGTHHISATSTRTVGVDVSANAVSEATKRYGSEKVEFRVADGGKLPADDGTFDLICSCQVIEHIAEMDAYLGEIRRVLAPGGKVIFTTPNAAIRLDPGMKPWNQFHVREFRAGELEALLRPWFDGVEVQGLFATQELYDSEIQRCANVRNKVRLLLARQKHPLRRARQFLVNIVKALIPGGVYRKLRGSLTKRPSPPAARDAAGETLAPETQARYSTDDYHYSTDRLDESIDLMAICHVKPA